MFPSSFAPREARPKVNPASGHYLILLFVSRGLVMNKKFQTAIKGGAVALVIMLTTGCSAELQSQVDAMNARVDTMASDVARAVSAADAAGASASEARQMASGAQSTANQALNAANQSQACCDATNKKIDRMFQKGMSK